MGRVHALASLGLRHVLMPSPRVCGSLVRGAFCQSMCAVPVATGVCPAACAIHSVCRRHGRVGTFVCGARAWRFVTERSARNETWLILKADTRVGACCVIPPHASVVPNSRVPAWISRVRAREIRHPWFPREFHVLLWALLGLHVGLVMFARGHGRSPEHSAWRECGGSVTSPGSCV